MRELCSLSLEKELYVALRNGELENTRKFHGKRLQVCEYPRSRIFWNRFGVNMGGRYKRHSRFKEEDVENKGRIELKESVSRIWNSPITSVP